MIHSLGRINIAAGGTPENIVAAAIAAGTESDPGIEALVDLGQAIHVARIGFRSWHDNANRIWVGNAATMNLTTGLNVLDFLNAANNQTHFELIGGQPGSQGFLDLRQLWVDGTTDEGVLVHYESVRN